MTISFDKKDRNKRAPKPAQARIATVAEGTIMEMINDDAIIVFVVKELRYLADQLETGRMQLTSVVISTPAMNSPTPARIELEVTPTTLAIKKTT